jgi:aromatic amino acid aminotransferase I
LEVDWRRHPLAASWAHDEIEEQIFMASIDHGALVTRGSWFFASSDTEQPSMFFRATFAAAPFEQIDAAIKRFGDAIREVFGLEKVTNSVGNGHTVLCNGHA